LLFGFVPFAGFLFAFFCSDFVQGVMPQQQPQTTTAAGSHHPHHVLSPLTCAASAAEQ
jgi:hypothetical protein